MMYHIIVFENLRFRPFLRKARVFEKMRFFSVTVYAGCVWTIGQTGEKISAFKTKTDTCERDLKVMLHQAIRNDDF